jgi:hypothetical protein
MLSIFNVQLNCWLEFVQNAFGKDCVCVATSAQQRASNSGMFGRNGMFLHCDIKEIGGERSPEPLAIIIDDINRFGAYT